MGVRFRSLVAASIAICLLAAAASAAPATAAKRPSVCGSGGFLRALEQPPAELPGALEASVLSSFAVFARPQLPTDLLPPISSAASSLGSSLASYYPAEIRQLAALPDGRRFIAVPGFERQVRIPPAVCLPKAIRKERSKLVQEQNKRGSQPAFCVVEIGGKRSEEGPGAWCSLFSDAARPEAIFDPLIETDSTAALVPNGVAAVRIVYPHAQSVTIAVSENAYLVEVPAAITRIRHKLGRQLDRLNLPFHPSKKRIHAFQRRLRSIFHHLETETAPLRVEWLGPSGTVLQTVKPDAKHQRLVIV